ncbi:Lysophospholipase D gdpd1 [Bulinus truncatus]|nr:Lysophospholipase D gdpd1 [Bulinus truncatus]
MDDYYSDNVEIVKNRLYLCEIIIMVYLFLLGSYVLVSYVFFKYPNILHIKKNLKFQAKHISHRGGAAERIENTMEAFRHAVDVGTDMLELDCQLTKDGQVVVCHDDNLLRTCNSDLFISETLYAELPPMMDKVRVDFYQKLCGEGEDHRIPLLEEVFQEFPNVAINIDIKENNDILMNKVNELIIYYSREELTAWGNRSDEICQKLYKLNPQVPLIFSLRQVTLLIILYWTGLLPFFNIKESLLEIIVPGIMLDSDELLDKPLNGRVRFFFWMMDKLLIRPSLIKHLEARGIQTYLWVLNREKDFDRAFKAGATGVMSDRIELLRNYLDNKRSSSTLEAKED